jgi:hypothetical protein
MVRETDGLLTTAEAKARLREVAGRVGFTHYVQHNPYNTVAYALIGGLLLGGAPWLRRAVLRMAVSGLPLLLLRRH